MSELPEAILCLKDTLVQHQGVEYIGMLELVDGERVISIFEKMTETEDEPIITIPVVSGDEEVDIESISFSIEIKNPFLLIEKIMRRLDWPSK